MLEVASIQELASSMNKVYKNLLDSFNSGQFGSLTSSQAQNVLSSYSAPPQLNSAVSSKDGGKGMTGTTAVGQGGAEGLSSQKQGTDLFYNQLYGKDSMSSSQSSKR